MKAKEFIPASKPRNFVAKNQQTAGAGAHRDKKKEQKQGYEKHKGKGVAEGSYTTEKQILTRIRQIMHDRKLSGTESNAGELLRLKQQLKDMRSQQSVSEGYGTREFEVDGYTYMTDLDQEDDNEKIFHMLKTPDGKTINVDFTPYAYMNKDDVKLYVKLGMPKRQGSGPLDREQLQKMAQIKGVAMLDRDMARAGMKDEAYDDWGGLSHREFKRRELQHELGHEDDPDFERKLRQQQMDRDRGPWYIRIDGKIYKQKGEPKVFDWKKGANNYALAILKNRPELKDKIMLTRNLVDQ